ncbi:Formate dehydrogenase-O, major subunit @ selenocysteine-containing [Campylobacter sputorum subsp. bubulus]|uniref:Formate dehydrogenase-O, major subunit @ selenocysteine-containing n=2 Tax=Campylobacter sputorum TaxID=206 RepID=A0A381DJF5_9BACT|nr:molybdopterin-dependent oxidoreductase [Campylobacter sputorum subsp. sputorum]SUX09141.1 Formate dehydrogenase-O, major subunit @ selenocysteine-containing [Campylobacter sputorum subsp. bubulus]SUX10832.1 Formate dehydrogenase-O, major subunit @ selenocysteine-containing [Campylobacter sputorum subsp. sputorum]
MSKTTYVGRRSFLKLAALGAAASSAFGSNETLRSATKEEIKNPFPNSVMKRTICSICSVGCGIEAEVDEGSNVWIRQDMAVDHPISQGSHCCKGIDQIDLTKSKMRLKYPLKKVNGKWERISWETAVNEIGDKMLKIREEDGPDSVEFLGSAKFSNEQAFYFRKFAAFWGTNNIDHVARI